MEAYELLKRFTVVSAGTEAKDAALNAKCLKLLAEFDEHMSDDFNTAKVLASMFELVPVINSVKDGLIQADALPSSTLIFNAAKI